MDMMTTWKMIVSDVPAIVLLLLLQESVFIPCSTAMLYPAPYIHRYLDTQWSQNLYEVKLEFSIFIPNFRDMSHAYLIMTQI